MLRIKGIKRNIWVFGFVSLLNDMTSEAILPLLPRFLVTYLGATPEILGIIEGIAKATNNLSQPLFGYLSDKLKKRKPFVGFGYATSVLGRFLVAISLAWPLVLVGRFIDRLGKGMRTPARDAMIAEFSDRSARGTAFGIHQALDSSGAVLGPLMAYLLLPHIPGLLESLKSQFSWFSSFNELNLLFLLMLIPAILAIPLIFIFVEETKFKSSSRERNIVTPRLKKFLIGMFLFNLANFPIAFVLLRAGEVGFDLGSTLLVYILFNISYVIFAYPSGRLIDKLGGKTVLVSSALVLAVSSLAFIPSSQWSFVLGFVAFAGFYALYQTSTKTVTSLLSSQEKLGSSYGVLDFTIGMANLASGILMGFIWTNFGPGLAFVAVSALSLLSALFLWFVI